MVIRPTTNYPVVFDEVLEAESSRKSGVYGKSFGCNDIKEEEGETRLRLFDFEGGLSCAS